jgi:hypothetical protein
MLYKVAVQDINPAPYVVINSMRVSIQPGTILDVYKVYEGYFLVWNEQVANTFFTISTDACRPV